MCDYNNQKESNAPEEDDSREKENIDKKSLDEMNEHVSFEHITRVAQIVSDSTRALLCFHDDIFFDQTLNLDDSVGHANH